MTKELEQALQAVDQALSTLQANRDVHGALIRSMEIIKKAISTKPNEKDSSSPDKK